MSKLKSLTLALSSCMFRETRMLPILVELSLPESFTELSLKESETPNSRLVLVELSV